MQDEIQEFVDAPNSLNAILDPADALAAAQRMQRWYQSTAQGIAHSVFGRDGRRIDGRPGSEATLVEFADAEPI
jgi:hypothetical protein